MVNNHARWNDEQPSDERVAALLEAAAAPSSPGPLPGEDAALAAFRAARPTPWRSSVRARLVPVKATLAAAVTGGVLLTGGVAAAAGTGALPGAAQDTARDWLAKVGVSVPGADEHAAGHADQRGDDADTDAADAADPKTDDGTDGAEDKGSEVSKLATTTDSKGVDKGAEVSTLASGGKSKAGQHGKAGDEHGKAGDEHGKAGDEHGDSAKGTAHKPATTPAEPTKPVTPAEPDGAGSSSAGSDHRP